jgi:hypothetical protein
MVFSPHDADRLVATLDQVLGEDAVHTVIAGHA